MSFNKSSVDAVDVFFLTNGFLGKRLENYNERDGFEAIDYVQVFSYDSSGTNSNARYDVDDTRLGNNFVRARYKAGDNGSDYAVAIEIFTTDNKDSWTIIFTNTNGLSCGLVGGEQGLIFK